MIHFRYSTILNIVFICSMYGTAMPLVFPIALLAFVILYISERLQIFYFYKQPPAFDEKLTMNTLRMLLYSPLVFISFTYWYLSNNQIFANIVFPQNSVIDVLQSGHYLPRSIQSLRISDPSFPALLMTLIFFALIHFGTMLLKVIEYLHPGIFDIDFTIDENLPNFFDAIDPEDRKFILLEEANLRKNYVNLHYLSNIKYRT